MKSKKQIAAEFMAELEEEIAAQGQDPRRELATIRARVAEIDEKASVLLEGLSADTKGFVDAKLRDLGNERRKFQNRCEELETTPYEPIDADAVLQHGMAALRDLPRLLESGSLEERKEFVRAFVGEALILCVTAANLREHTIISLALAPHCSGAHQSSWSTPARAGV